MRVLHFLLALWLPAAATTALAAEPVAGAFDYYTLAITLTPAYCDHNPKLRKTQQCRARRPLNVHGLWPTRSKGAAPEFCAGPALALSPAREQGLRNLMPDAGWRQQEWERRGRCSGLDADSYFAMVEKEFQDLKLPAQLQAQGRNRLVKREALLAEFHRLNPGFPARGVMLRCSNKGRPQMLTEIHVCLTPDGYPTECVANFTPNCPVSMKLRGR
ncbi:MAG: ribonuclease [Moraxellaceae bacterium]|jgi:ribonuclease T2|nr:ribonuclease [Moraxellaceae bacterium]